MEMSWWETFIDWCKNTDAETHALIWPFLVYWATGLIFYGISLLKWPCFEKYACQPLNLEQAKNPELQVHRVVVRVLIQQMLQSVMVLICSRGEKYLFGEEVQETDEDHIWYIRIARVVAAALIMDAYQYWIHRLAHEWKWLYRNMHSTHHRLLMPYAFGALYNHPVESFLLDAVSGGLSIGLTGLLRDKMVGVLFLCLATMKTVDDHCGYRFPWDPLQILFPNNSWYHDVHHQRAGLKMNYSQPFFVFWDKLCGTYCDPDKFHEYIKTRGEDSQDTETKKAK